jgi:peptidyl-prolyl cis-trans isomerase SurA
MRKSTLIPASLAFALSVWAASSKVSAAPTAEALALEGADVVETIIARVNNEVITSSELNRQRDVLRQELQQHYTGIQMQTEFQGREKDLLRDLIDQSLLLQKGKDEGISAEAETIKQMDSYRKQFKLKDMEELEKYVNEIGLNFDEWKANIKNQIISREVVNREVGSHIQVAKEDIAKFYEEHKKDMQHPEQVWLQDLLVAADPKKADEMAAAQKKAADLLARVRKGEDFGAVASKESSDTNTAPSGGDMGRWWKRGDIDPAIEKVVFAAKKGDITEPIATGSGWIFFKVNDHQLDGVSELAEVSQQIQEHLYALKMQPKMRDYLTKLRDEAYMEIRSGYVDTGAPRDEKGELKATTSAHLIPVDAPVEDLTTTVARAKKDSGKKVYKPWTWFPSSVPAVSPTPSTTPNAPPAGPTGPPSL